MIGGLDTFEIVSPAEESARWLTVAQMELLLRDGEVKTADGLVRIADGPFRLRRPPDLRQRGGPGSGHFGHEGRPGEVGGSLPSGQSDIYIGVSADLAEPGAHDYDLNSQGIEQPTGAPVRGIVISPDDPRIPDTVFHMTTNLPAVREAGELSARGAGGLGGDKMDQIVSMSADEGIVKQLASDMKFLARLSREMVPTEPLYDFDHETNEWLSRDRQTGEIVDHRAWSQKVVARMNQLDDSAGDWEFNWDFTEHTPAYYLQDWMRQYFIARSSGAGIKNPIIFTDPQDLAAIDPAKVGYVRIPRPNLRTGAMLTDLDLDNPYGLKEVRLYGDVPLTDAEFVGD